MVSRYFLADSFRRYPTILFCYFLLLSLHHVAATRFSERIDPISPQVPLRMMTLEQCVGNGTSVYVVPDSERICPCSLFVSDQRQPSVDGEYLIVRKEDYEAWESSGSNSQLFADVKVKIIAPDLSTGRRRIDIPNQGQHVLLVRTKTTSEQCLELNYMFAAQDRKYCPTRMNSQASEGEDLGISHSIIAGTSHVDEQIQNFMVGVYTDGKGACTGSVVAKHWVLTAAHCAPEPNSSRIFVGGEYFSSGSEYIVSDVYLHPDFSSGAGPDGTISSAVINDIALLRTSNPIDVIPIGINHNENIPQPRDIVRAVGYGLTFSESKRGTLNSVDVSESPIKECKKKYKEVSGGVDLDGLSSRHHICAGPDEVCDGGVCRGDSGGPLMVKRGEYYVQVGVTSFGLDCEYKTFAPDVFARVSKHAEWIEKTTNQDILTVDGALAIIDSPQNRTSILQDRLIRSRQRRRTIWYAVGGGSVLFLLVCSGISAYFYVKWRDSRH